MSFKKYKSLQYDVYGTTEKLRLVEIQSEDLKRGEIRIKIKAASLNPVDWKVMQGEMKIMTGSKFPRGFGCDCSGVVEEIGADVAGFKVGDAVVGWMPYKIAGTFSEYATMPMAMLVKKPENITFEEAACLPMAGIAALQALAKGKVTNGTKVFVNGGNGAVGGYIIQLAKSFGATVVATSSKSGLDQMKADGADQVFDYASFNPSDITMKFDLVIDTPTKLSKSMKDSLCGESGIYVDFNPTPLTMLKSFICRRDKFMITSVKAAELEKVTTLASKRVLKPRIAQTFSLDQSIAKISEVASGKARPNGRVVLVNK